MTLSIARVGVALLLGLGLLLPAGCNLLGAAAAKMPKPDIDAAYKGLAGQKVGIMVWADGNSTLIDWPQVQLHLGAMLQEKLKKASKDSKELAGISFPYEAASFVRYQKEHPALEASSILDVAPKLGVTRLIYIEVGNLTTRAAEAFSLKLGQMDANLKVIEIENNKAKLVFEDAMAVQFPRKSPKEGELKYSDSQIYTGTINEITTEMALRFIRHPDDTP
ncbi:MAG TPA: hypothetical protein VF624_19205 [Tepidisphaeraceae bacterium]|jgi:hypothetical protein